jgi:uncharacterized protein (TIGR02996 family)
VTDTQAALLRAIAAHPDEDTPRLMYADSLDEEGEPSTTARAEFIRLHVRAARLAQNAPERESVLCELDRLLYRWDSVWQKEMPAGFKTLSGYRRGFAYRAAALAAAVADAADDPRLLLVEHLELTAGESATALHRAVQQPLFARLLELVVRGGPLGRRGAQALATGEYPRLERLVLAQQSIGNVGLRDLCESWGFPQLRELDLSSNDLTDIGAAVLLDSTLYSRLRRVSVWGNSIGHELMYHLRAGGRV